VPRVTFTANLRRLVDCPPADVPGQVVSFLFQHNSPRDELFGWFSNGDHEASRRPAAAACRRPGLRRRVPNT